MLDYLILMRPTLFLPVWIFFLLGANFAGGNFSWEALIIFILYTMLMGGTYILNQIIDVKSDKRNRKLFLLSDDIIPVFHAYIQMFLLFILPLSLSWFMDFRIFIFFMISFVMGVLYSLPHVEFKGRPFLDLLWNSTGYGVIAFSVGWISVSTMRPEMWIHTLPYFFAVGAVFVNTTIPDIKGDKMEGKITTGVFLGKKKTLILAVILDVLSIAISLIVTDYICLIASGLSLPVFIYACIRMDEKPVLLSIRATSLILAIAVCIITPIIIPAFLLVYGVQKYYYRKKFDINYPAVFSGADREF